MCNNQTIDVLVEYEVEQLTVRIRVFTEEDVEDARVHLLHKPRLQVF